MYPRVSLLNRLAREHYNLILEGLSPSDAAEKVLRDFIASLPSPSTLNPTPKPNLQPQRTRHGHAKEA